MNFEEKLDEKLKNITQDSLKTLSNVKIIPPKLYEQTFEGIAKKKDVNKKVIQQLKVVNPLEEETNDKANNLYEKITSSIHEVKEQTHEAVMAIQGKDEITLAKIHERMKMVELELKTIKEELYIDNLTKAYNRKWFEEKEMLNNSMKSKGILYFIDLNEFKVINDTFGHVIGDKVLQIFVSEFKKHLSIYDSNVIRYAGDEFLVILKALSFNETQKIFESIVQKFAKQQWKTIKGELFKISFSYGGVEYKEEDNFSRLIEQADEKMYLYKNNTKKNN